MSRHSQRSTRSTTHTVVAAAFAVAGLAVTGAGVYAGLNAEATSSQSVTSGTLKLNIGNESGSLFTSAVSGLAPGDVVNRYVNLTNNGLLPALSLTLKVAGSTALATDATKGLAVTVSSCSTSWAVSAGTASCTSGGTITQVMTSTPVATLAVTPGAVQASMAVNEVAHLQISLKLPNSSETTTNGVLPSGTIQGLTDTLTYTFNEVQRAATTTES